LVLKISKLFQRVDKFKRNNYYFLLNYQFPLDLELKIQETNQIQNCLNFKGVQTIGKKFHKFTKNLS
jgi:hypothetical protein